MAVLPEKGTRQSYRWRIARWSHVRRHHSASRLLNASIQHHRTRCNNLKNVMVSVCCALENNTSWRLFSPSSQSCVCMSGWHEITSIVPDTYLARSFHFLAKVILYLFVVQVKSFFLIVLPILLILTKGASCRKGCGREKWNNLKAPSSIIIQYTLVCFLFLLQ